jgi:hypothetical protein
MTLAALACAIVAGPMAGGCGYSVHAPYSHEIKTVYVPLFRSISFRREVQLQLSELLVKEIERRSPYKVVGTADGADTVLDGTINFADKNIVVENPFNYPRQLTATITASVSWNHNPPTSDDLDRGPTQISEMVNFVPEIGETSETAFYRANQLVARQIVDMMEAAW